MFQEMLAWFGENHWAEHALQAIIVGGGVAALFGRWFSTLQARFDAQDALLHQLVGSPKGSGDLSEKFRKLRRRINNGELDWAAFKDTESGAKIAQEMHDKHGRPRR